MNTTHTNILLSVKELAQRHALVADVVFFGCTNMTFNSHESSLSAASGHTLLQLKMCPFGRCAECRSNKMHLSCCLKNKKGRGLLITKKKNDGGLR